MAFDFSKLNFFSKLDARARVFVLFAVVIGVGVGIYLLASFMSSDSATLGPSTVANAPQGLQSVPGAQLNPEFARAVRQANEQAAKQAQMSGGSAVPTLINTGQQVSPDAQCTVLCGEDTECVKTNIDTWVKTGKVGADIANALQTLANKNVAVAEFGAMLNKHVQDGKLTPEQARILLECYTKQHLKRQVEASAKTLDTYIKSGKLPLDAANSLLEAQKKNMTPAEYAAALQAMVKAGKIDSETAQRLLNQYIQQRAAEIVSRSITSLKQMLSAGQLTPDVEASLEDLENRMVSVNEYQKKLQGYVDAGKMTPIVSKAILDEFKQQKSDIGNISSMNSLVQQAYEEAYAELRDLQKDGKITPETASIIKQMIDKNVSSTTFEAEIAQLQQEGKLTPEIAKLKLADYKKIQDLQALSDQLNDLRNNNAPCSDQEDPLKNAVAAGALTPEQAAQLMKECQASQIQANGASQVAGTGDFAQLQQRLQSSGAANSSAAPAVSPEVFSQAQARNQQDLEQARQARIEAMVQAMSGQAGQLLAAWAPPTMSHKAGTPPEKKTKGKDAESGTATGDSATNTAAGANNGENGSTDAPVIKAGTILFAVLDTTVNSDYPDSPVLATVVEGKFKGAKMLGKLVITKGVTGQMDRITLNFTLMNMDSWSKSKSATAYAIDPDTARSALASSVNNHYLYKNAMLIASGFAKGFGEATLASGGQSTQSAFGTSTTNPVLTTSSKISAAIGEVANFYVDQAKKRSERPPTVIVDSGVGLGILFMTDVT